MIDSVLHPEPKKRSVCRLLMTLGGVTLVALGLMVYKALLIFEFARGLGTWGGQPHLSDRVMIDHFLGHEAEFQSLLGMIQKDKPLERVDMDWTLPANPMEIGITSDRVKAYRKVFAELGIHRGFKADEARNAVELIASSQGSVLHGSSKSFYFSATRPSPLVSDLDPFRQLAGPMGYGFRHIKGNWYLRFQWD